MSKEEIDYFYRLTMIDIRDGIDLEELKYLLDLYEEEENYLACAGIHKAIQEAKHKTIKEIRYDTEN